MFCVYGTHRKKVLHIFYSITSLSKEGQVLYHVYRQD